MLPKMLLALVVKVELVLSLDPADVDPYILNEPPNKPPDEFTAVPPVLLTTEVGGTMPNNPPVVEVAGKFPNILTAVATGRFVDTFVVLPELLSSFFFSVALSDSSFVSSLLSTLPSDSGSETSAGNNTGADTASSVDGVEKDGAVLPVNLSANVC